MQAEADYLTLQATLAKARLRHSASRLAEELLTPLDLRTVVRRRPWWSLGGAGLVGFLTARGLHRKSRSAQPASGGKAREMIADVGRRVRRIVSSALGGMVVASLQGTASPPVAPPTNGHTRAVAPE